MNNIDLNINKLHKDSNNSYLFRYAIMAFPLSFLGIPLYINLPKFYHDYYSLSISTIGVILFASRILDAIIDPFFGLLSDKFHLSQKKYLIAFSVFLILFFNTFFYLGTNHTTTFALSWFAFCTLFVYLFFSLVFINYYNLGLQLVQTNSLRVKLSSFRESLGFLGMIVASITPSLLTLWFGDELNAFRVYGLIFSGFIILGLIFLPPLPLKHQSISKQELYDSAVNNLTYIYRNQSMRWLIILFFINSLPIAITSNLFSFYIDESLAAKSSMALFLISYLLSSAFSALMCSLFFKSANKINVLIMMMIISASGFSITYFLNPSNSYIFYLVCIVSGLGLGGEIVMLTSIAATIMNDHLDYGNTFFSLWSTCTKITLAIAAGVFLPLMSINSNFLTEVTLANKIAFFYSIIPLLIKCISIGILLLIKPKLSGGLT